MSKRISATLALVAFGMCQLIGIQAQNSFATTIQRALVAMAGTYVIGLIVGAMGQRMIDENLKVEEQKLKDVK